MVPRRLSREIVVEVLIHAGAFIVNGALEARTFMANGSPPHRRRRSTDTNAVADLCRYCVVPPSFLLLWKTAW